MVTVVAIFLFCRRRKERLRYKETSSNLRRDITAETSLMNDLDKRVNTDLDSSSSTLPDQFTKRNVNLLSLYSDDNLHANSQVPVYLPDHSTKTTSENGSIGRSGCVCRGSLARQQAAEFGNMQTGSRVTVRLTLGSQRHSLLSSVTTVSSSRDELLEALENAKRHPPPPVLYESQPESSSQPTDSSVATEPGIREFTQSPPKPNEQREASCEVPPYERELGELTVEQARQVAAEPRLTVSSTQRQRCPLGASVDRWSSHEVRHYRPVPEEDLSELEALPGAESLDKGYTDDFTIV
nr:hypothetical protein BaRGS_014352 [Batillaria attramentaria]